MGPSQEKREERWWGWEPSAGQAWVRTPRVSPKTAKKDNQNWESETKANINRKNIEQESYNDYEKERARKRERETEQESERERKSERANTTSAGLGMVSSSVLPRLVWLSGPLMSEFSIYLKIESSDLIFQQLKEISISKIKLCECAWAKNA